jgi:hypothetical protein
VKYDIPPGNRAATYVHIAQIAAQKLDLVRDAGEIGFVSGAEIVYYPNVVAEGHQLFGQMGADEAGTPGHQAS